MEHEYYSPREAAAYLGLAPLTLAVWRSQGKGPVYHKMGEGKTDRIVYRLRFLKLWKDRYEKQKTKHKANDLKPKRERKKGDQRSIARKIEEGTLPVGWPVVKAGVER